MSEKREQNTFKNNKNSPQKQNPGSQRDQFQLIFDKKDSNKTKNLFIKKKLLVSNTQECQNSHYSGIQIEQNEKNHCIEHPFFKKSKITGRCISRIYRLQNKFIFYREVFIGQELETNSKYAVKAFDKEGLKNERAKQAILNEILILQSLNHANILKLKECFEGQNTVYLVMDLVEGKELGSIIKTREYTMGDLQQIMKNILIGLEYIHSKGMIHRDLKPSNILLKSTKCKHGIVIADFGLATKLNDIENLYGKCGTPGYVAPEILRFCQGQPLYNQKSDIFSVGVIFMLLLTGHHPFRGDNQKQTLKLNRQSQVNPLLTSMICNMESRNLVSKMLEQKPSDRLTASECLQHPFFDIDFSSDTELFTSKIEKIEKNIALNINILTVNAVVANNANQNLLNINESQQQSQNRSKLLNMMSIPEMSIENDYLVWIQSLWNGKTNTFQDTSFQNSSITKLKKLDFNQIQDQSCITSSQNSLPGGYFSGVIINRSPKKQIPNTYISTSSNTRLGRQSLSCKKIEQGSPSKKYNTFQFLPAVSGQPGRKQIKPHSLTPSNTLYNSYLKKKQFNNSTSYGVTSQLQEKGEEEHLEHELDLEEIYNNSPLIRHKKNQKNLMNALTQPSQLSAQNITQQQNNNKNDISFTNNGELVSFSNLLKDNGNNNNVFNKKEKISLQRDYDNLSKRNSLQLIQQQNCLAQDKFDENSKDSLENYENTMEERTNRYNNSKFILKSKIQVQQNNPFKQSKF